MKIIDNAYVNKVGAYYESGGLIEGTQRISSNHLFTYWQQENYEINLAKKVEDFKKIKSIDEALYVGRIPTHFGHFLMEGLPRLCDAIDNKLPLIGFINYGKPPLGKEDIRIRSIEWIIDTITDKKFYRLKENDVYKLKRLYVSDLPVLLSQSCSEPWRMSPMIEKIVKRARKENPKINKVIDSLYLKKEGETIMYGTNECTDFSNPNTHISKQIANVSYAKKLLGKTGSNTHISMFANYDTFVNWKSRGDWEQGDRNQCICDIIKTFNRYK